MPGPNEYAMTLQDVSDRLAELVSLPVQTRREQQSAIVTFAKACGRTPSEIIADAQHVSFLLKDANWQRLGITKKSWANVQSRVRTALQLAGIDIAKRRNFKPAPVWEDLVAPLPPRKRQDLGRFSGYCTVRQISPHEVTSTTFDEFLRFNHEQVVQLDPREKWQTARRAWNLLGRTAPELGLPCIPNTEPPRWRGLTWNELPEQLRRDLEALDHWLLNVDLLADDEEEDGRDAVKPVTAFNYLNNLRRYVSHLVEIGVPLGEVSSLASILESNFVKRFFRYQIEKRGKTIQQLKEEGDTSLHAYLAALIAAARFVEVSDDQWKALVKIGDLVRRKQAELTPKNRARIKTLSEPDIEDKYLNLPLTIAKRLDGVKSPTIAQALEMQAAAALEFLLKAPLRIENVAKLDLERHIRRPGGGLPGTWLIHFDGHEVKNGNQIDLELNEATSALLDHYVTMFRPVLLRKGACSALFVNMHGDPKTKESLAKQLKKLIKREVGVKWNPHIVRAHAGWMLLEEQPGRHRRVQQILGHSSMDTTTSYYLGMEREASFRAYDEVVERRRAGVRSVEEIRHSRETASRGRRRAR